MVPRLICDLCGDARFEPVVESSRPKAMRSDRVIVDAPLRKVACRRCGLVRTGTLPAGSVIDNLYRDGYDTRMTDHMFYTPAGPVARSSAIADWMLAHTQHVVWQSGQAGLDVGAGPGLLMRVLQDRFPGKPLVGVEPNVHAAHEGRSGGLDIRPSMSELPPAIDVAWAVAVLEHVESPTGFLRAIRSRLSDGGTLILIQPTADVPSYDVLFIDHLHHFARPHLVAYAHKSGFEVMRSVIGHPLMPNFSLHVWRASSNGDDDVRWAGPPAESHCRTAACRVLAAMARLDDLLERLETGRRRVAAFGVREVFALARSYSTLDAFPLACGFDDDPEQVETGRFPFPIVRPEAASQFGITDALLTMNTLYYQQARQRCESLNLICHPVLDADPVE